MLYANKTYYQKSLSRVNMAPIQVVLYVIIYLNNPIHIWQDMIKLILHKI